MFLFKYQQQQVSHELYKLWPVVHLLFKLTDTAEAATVNSKAHY